MRKFLLALVLSAALFSQAGATPINNSGSPKAATITQQAKQATLREAASAKTVKVAPTTTPAPTPPIQPEVPQTHEGLMAAAGIQSKDYASVDYIISHESSWDPNATEPTTQAHGLPQALPYSKTGCTWTDAVCQLSWADSYATARYGSWSAAQAYWSVHRNW